jgi:hypothetical protein
MAAPFQNIPVEMIDVPYSQLDLGALDEPMASTRIGRTSEMVIVIWDKSRYWLFIGYDQYNLCKRLGCSEILACVLEVEDLYEELAKIDERLRRRELSTLECAEHIIRRKQIVDALPPGARYGNGPGPGHGEKARRKIPAPACMAGLKTKYRLRSIPKAELITIDERCRWCGGTRFLFISKEFSRLYCGCHSVDFLGSRP